MSQRTFKCEDQIVNRLVNRELGLLAQPVQSGESEIGAVSAPEVRTPGQKLLLLVGTEM